MASLALRASFATILLLLALEGLSVALTHALDALQPWITDAASWVEMNLAKRGIQI